MSGVSTRKRAVIIHAGWYYAGIETVVKSYISPLHPKHRGRLLPANEAFLYHLTRRKATLKWHWQILLPWLRAKLSRSTLLNTLVNGPHLVLG
jgi:hypothetical protein